MVSTHPWQWFKERTQPYQHDEDDEGRDEANELGFPPVALDEGARETGSCREGTEERTNDVHGSVRHKFLVREQGRREGREINDWL